MRGPSGVLLPGVKPVLGSRRPRDDTRASRSYPRCSRSRGWPRWRAWERSRWAPCGVGCRRLP